MKTLGVQEVAKNLKIYIRQISHALLLHSGLTSRFLQRCIQVVNKTAATTAGRPL
ncbi:MAG: hypothetical protein ACJAZ1_000230 [Yoonia sp.]|jgi:hypothetical protein